MLEVVVGENNYCSENIIIMLTLVNTRESLPNTMKQNKRRLKHCESMT